TLRSPTGSCSGRSRGAVHRSSTSMRPANRSLSSSACRRSGFPSPSFTQAPIWPQPSPATRLPLRRTRAVSLIPAAVFTTAWFRLENPIDRPLRSVAVAALAILPALVRRLAARVAVCLGSLVLGAWIAFELSPLHPRHLVGALGSRFSSGFLAF